MVHYGIYQCFQENVDIILSGSLGEEEDHFAKIVFVFCFNKIYDYTSLYIEAFKACILFLTIKIYTKFNVLHVPLVSNWSYLMEFKCICCLLNRS